MGRQKEPVFLGLEEALEIHQDQIERYGRRAGIRDMALLQSALAMPSAGSGGQYFHTDLHEMAAAYLFHIVKSPPFGDGKKHVGAMAAFVFLALNGIALKAPEPAFEKVVLSVAEGKSDKAAVAAFFRKHAKD